MPSCALNGATLSRTKERELENERPPYITNFKGFDFSYAAFSRFGMLNTNFAKHRISIDLSFLLLNQKSLQAFNYAKET